jgi:hypothetical protein
MEPHDELLETACRETGLNQFGDDSFRCGLERLVRALQDEAQLNAGGEVAIQRLVVGLLSQRLQIEDWYRRHPEIDDESIEAPLIGLGLPRTGSTALSHLLAQDPDVRYLRTWEASQPCPPPSTVTGLDPRLAAQTERQSQLSQRRRALSLSDASGPVECQSLMALDFKAHYFLAFAHIPSYSQWLIYEADLTSTYEYERRVLKLLQWGQPARPWRLKSPTHLLFLDHLDGVFPDARFVMTHRDPAEVMVSVADLYAEIASAFADHVDLHYLGALNVEQWSVGMQRAVDFRDRLGQDRFYDINFRAMQTDPLAEITGLYDWLGEPVTEAFNTAIEQWWRKNAETHEPNVHPDPATFGLDLDQIRPLFATYTDRMSAWISH